MKLVMETQISTILLKLSRDIMRVVSDVKKSKGIQKVKRLWVREKITDFKYQEGSLSWTSSSEYLEKEEWDWRDEFRILEEEIKKLPSYIQAHKVISDIYGVNEAQANFWLERFALHIIEKALNGEVGDEDVFETITIFLNDLEQNPIIWNVLAQIEGLWLKDEEIEIAKGIKIRKPRPSDLEFERPFELLHLPFPQPMFFHPSAIIEINQRAKFQPFVFDDLEKLIIALRLYKLGSITIRKTRWNPKSILQLGGTTWSGGIQPIVYQYGLAIEDSHKLQTFVNRIKLLLPFAQGKIQTVDHISISLQRYNDALFKSDPVERLAYAIMGLEALFLKSIEREELAHKLAQRVAKCISILGHQPLEIYRTVKQSYDVRSEFIHGSLLGEDKRREASKFADKIMEYLRVSLLIFLELKEKIEKENFLNTIDNSLLHQDAQVKLESLIKEHCRIIQNINVV
jgi:hypothetical protein